MSSGPIPGYADSIPQKMVEELCPVEFEAFMAAVTADSYLQGECGDGEEPETYLEYAVKDALMWEGKNDLDDATNEAWKALCAAFERATETNGKGLTLYVTHYDEDMGGTYDEIEGSLIWQVGQMYVLSPAGERFKDRITRQFYTQYG